MDLQTMKSMKCALFYKVQFIVGVKTAKMNGL